MPCVLLRPAWGHNACAIVVALALSVAYGVGILFWTAPDIATPSGRLRVFPLPEPTPFKVTRVRLLIGTGTAPAPAPSPSYPTSGNSGIAYCS